MAGLGFHIQVLAGACQWHGVGGFCGVFSSLSGEPVRHLAPGREDDHGKAKTTAIAKGASLGSDVQIERAPAERACHTRRVRNKSHGDRGGFPSHIILRQLDNAIS